jgi:hypothetical protein
VGERRRARTRTWRTMVARAPWRWRARSSSKGARRQPRRQRPRRRRQRPGKRWFARGRWRRCCRTRTCSFATPPCARAERYATAVTPLRWMHAHAHSTSVGTATDACYRTSSQPRLHLPAPVGRGVRGVCAVCVRRLAKGRICFSPSRCSFLRFQVEMGKLTPRHRHHSQRRGARARCRRWTSRTCTSTARRRRVGCRSTACAWRRARRRCSWTPPIHVRVRCGRRSHSCSWSSPTPLTYELVLVHLLDALTLHTPSHALTCSDADSATHVNL